MRKLRKACVAVLAGLAIVTAAPGYAADNAAAALITRPSIGNLNVHGPANAWSFIAADIPGGSAARIHVAAPAPGANPWDIGAGAVLTSNLRKGDTLTATFWARAPEGSGQVSARLQGNDAPYTGLGQQDIAIDGQWRLYTLKGRAEGDFVAGRAGLSLSLNSRQQIVEIGPVYIFKNLSVDASPDAIKALPVGGRIDSIITTPGGETLAATLYTPPGKGPFPAVTQITGSGPWGRNPFDPVANALLGQGLAVLQFDKRGVGQSTGNLASASVDDLIQDTAAVAAWLKRQPGIAANRTGVIGGSQGGMLAMAVAARDPQVAFVISLAGPGQPEPEWMIGQVETTMTAQGASAEAIRATLAMTREGLEALAAATGDDDAAARLTAALAPYVGKLITQADADALIAQARDPAIRAAMLFDPGVDMQKVKVPVLGLFGTLDLQVPPDANAAAMRRGLAGNPDVTVIILTGFNHLFQRAQTGTVEEWATLKEVGGSDPEFLKVITDWVATRGFSTQVK